MEMVHPQAAGIDLGSREIYVCAPDGEIRKFGTFTQTLRDAVAYLQDKGTRTVAMESTGVYWVVLYDLLEVAGLEVYLVNAAHVKRVPGRKSDVQDCQWLQRLHRLGLLSKSHIAPEPMRVLRQYVRHRENLLQAASGQVNLMHKALTLMNIQLHQVISRVQDGSGMRVLRAILEGERDPNRLLALCDKRIINAKAEDVLRSLVGNYREEHLFALGQAVAAYDFFMAQMAVCDAQIQAQLEAMTEPLPPPPTPTDEGNASSANPDSSSKKGAKRKAIRHHAPKVTGMGNMLLKLTGGNDPTALPGMTDYGVLRLLSIIGTDMSAWPTAEHFASWLKLAPVTQQSGRTQQNKRTRRNHPAAQVFREAAQAIGNSTKIALGTFYRQVRARKGPKIANVATARKLAIHFYNTLKHGFAFVEQGIEQAEKCAQQRIVKALTRKAHKMGFELVQQPV